MKPVKTENSNHNFGPPPNVTDGSIGDLPCQFVSEDGYREVISVWELNRAEREAIVAGYNVRLGVGWIGSMPPVSVGVTHEVAVGRPAVARVICENGCEVGQENPLLDDGFCQNCHDYPPAEGE